MKRQSLVSSFVSWSIAVAVLFALLLTPSRLMAQGTAFTYQGRLDADGVPANGSYDLQFALFFIANGGPQTGNTLTNTAAAISNGLFTVTLDFGDQYTSTSILWLQIGVRTNGAGEFTTLVPRQRLTPTPYAVHAVAANSAGTATTANSANTASFAFTASAAATATTATTALSANFATTAGSAAFAAYATNAGFASSVAASNITGILASAQLPPDLALSVTNGLNLNVTPVPLSVSQSSVPGGAFGIIQGDHYAGLAAGTNGFIIYDVAVPASPIIVAQTNQGTFTIGAGGGDSGVLYLACGTNGLVACIVTNALAPVIASRTTNAGSAYYGVQARNGYAYVSASPDTLIYSVSNLASPVLLGQITNNASVAGLALGGNDQLYYAGQNSLRLYSVTNPAAPQLITSIAATGATQVILDGGRAFVACRTNGFKIFDVSNSTNFAPLVVITNAGSGISTLQLAVAGNRLYAVNSLEGIRSYDISTITNPVSLRVVDLTTQPTAIALNGPYAYVADALSGLLILGLGDVANFISGSSSNSVIGQVIGATISGGGAQAYLISMNGQSQSVGGPNLAGGDFATVGGGVNNVIGVGSLGATIGGGVLNRIGTNALVATIGGGFNGSIGGNSQNAVLAGGDGNAIGSQSATATIGGGGKNAIGANAPASVISGGNQNIVSNNAQYATIPGGNRNTAGSSYTLAAGNNAKAIHSGSFVWADSQFSDFASTANDQVSFRAQGGVRFTSGSGSPNQTVVWTPGSASWSFTSDRNLKDRVAPVNGPSILEKVSRIPINEWSYIGHDQRHIGPMAQDFHAQFPLNENDKVLNDADLHGVALAAIQGLNQKVEDQNHLWEAKLQQKEAEIAELKARMEKLEQLLEKKLNGAAR
jgi:hypothetical protein